MRIGMVFQKPNPFPKSIFENVAYGLRIRGMRSQIRIQEEVEKALRGAALWDEVKDRLGSSALSLSGGQQQRLCIARALATNPEILLFDEPTSALDPIATARIEELIAALREQVTVLIVTHNMQQAARVSDYTAFMYLGELIEFDETSKIFTNPEPKGHRRLHHRPLRLVRRYGRACSEPKVPGALAFCSSTPGAFGTMPLAGARAGPVPTMRSGNPSPLTSATATSLAFGAA